MVPKAKRGPPVGEDLPRGGLSITRRLAGRVMADGDSPAIAATQTRAALNVARGIGRLFARNGIWCLAEMPLRSNRRADLMGIDGKGRVVIVEIKVSRADLLGDGKWTDYLDHCDHYYWGLPPELDRSPLESAAFLPDRCGVIVADGYDGEIIRSAPSLPLAAARRKAEIERLAKVALRRLMVGSDPQLSNWP